MDSICLQGQYMSQKVQFHQLCGDREVTDPLQLGAEEQLQLVLWMALHHNTWPVLQVSCDWWTPGHVTTVLTSDWCSRPCSPAPRPPATSSPSPVTSTSAESWPSTRPR